MLQCCFTSSYDAIASYVILQSRACLSSNIQLVVSYAWANMSPAVWLHNRCWMTLGCRSLPGLRTPPLEVPRKLNLRSTSIVVKMNDLRYVHVPVGRDSSLRGDVLVRQGRMCPSTGSRPVACLCCTLKPVLFFFSFVGCGGCFHKAGVKWYLGVVPVVVWGF